MYQSSIRSVFLPNLSELLTSQQRLGSAGVCEDVHQIHKVVRLSVTSEFPLKYLDIFWNSPCQSCLYETYWLYWLDSGSKSGMPLKYPIASIFHWKRLYHLWFAHLLTKGIDVLICQIWRYLKACIESNSIIGVFTHFEIFSGFLRLPHGFSMGLSHIFPIFQGPNYGNPGVRTWKAKQPSHGFLHLDIGGDFYRKTIEKP